MPCHSPSHVPETTFPISLASASPRRLQLLKQIGIIPEQVIHPEIDETPRKEELPRVYAKRMAQEKLLAGQKLLSTPHCILTADTVAAVGRRILNKTQDMGTAEKQLRLLSGRRHRVYTAVTLSNPKNNRMALRLVCTIVRFSRLTEQQIMAYLHTHEWQGKTGSYAIQGQAASFIQSIQGSYSNVVGLPLFETAQLLRGQGLLP